MTAGFNLSRTHSQGDVTGKQFEYDVDAAHVTILAPGDAIRVTGVASADGTPQADASTATVSVTGILFAVKPNFTGEALSNTALPATTAGSIQVDVDPRALYEVDVSGTTLVVGDVNQNIDLVATAATTTGGLSISNMTVNGTTAGANVLFPFTIIALLTSDAGVFGDRALVRVNASTVTPGSLGLA